MNSNTPPRLDALKDLAHRVISDLEGAQDLPDKRKSFFLSEAEDNLVAAYAGFRHIDSAEAVRRLVQELAYSLADGRDPMGQRFFPTPLEGKQLLDAVVALGLTNKQLNSGLYPVKEGSRKQVTIQAMQKYFDEGIQKNWSFQHASANEKLVYRLKHIVDAYHREKATGADRPVSLEDLIAAAIKDRP